MNLTFLIKFNNYQNRKNIIYSTYNEYISGRTAGVGYVVLTNMNFKVLDGVDTKCTVNNWTYNIPDYLVVTDKNNNILYRYFVTDSDMGTKGTYIFTLHRDVLSDYQSEFLQSKAYIEKGIVDTDDPLIFNSEGMNFNQIKKEEILLKDETKCGWIVGYLDKKYPTADLNITIQSAIDTSSVLVTSDLPWEIKDLNGKPRKSNYLNTADDAFFVFGYDSYPDVKSNPNGYTYSKYRLKFDINTWNKGDVVVSANQKYMYSHSNFQVFPFKCNKFIDKTKIYNAYNANTVIIPNEIKNWISTNRVNSLSSNPMEFNNKILSYNGEHYRIKISLGQADISLSSQQMSTDQKNALLGMYTTIVNNLSTNGEPITVKTAEQLQNTSPYYRDFELFVLGESYIVNYEKIFSETYTTTLHKYDTPGRVPTIDATYDIFAIPYGKCNVKIDNNLINIDGESALYVGRNIATSLGTACYDLQILPYCPVRDLIDADGNILLSSSDVGKRYEVVKDNNNNNVNVIIFSKTCRGTFDILNNLSIEPYKQIKDNSVINQDVDELTISEQYQHFSNEITLPNTDIDNVNIEGFNVRISDNNTSDIDISNQIITKSNDGSNVLITMSWDVTCNTWPLPVGDDKVYCGYEIIYTQYLIIDELFNIATKIDNECNMYRLNSPNGSNGFDFSVAKNGGVNYFNVDFTYKPCQPYIHINPNFKNLYGKDWDDTRGLILGGDYSISSISDTFIEYQNQNKNFEAIFNREIQNMDTQREIQKKQEIWSAIGGSFQAGGSGALAGGMVGGPIGAGVGAVAGFGTSLAAGLADRKFNQQLYDENKSYKTDLYNLNLSNVKARPNGISRTDALVNNFKIWPFIEVFKPTDVEVETFKEKLKYNGMSIGVIGIPNDFIGSNGYTFIQGQIIDMQIEDDTHVWQSIADEFKKGVRM